MTNLLDTLTATALTRPRSMAAALPAMPVLASHLDAIAAVASRPDYTMNDAGLALVRSTVESEFRRQKMPVKGSHYDAVVAWVASKPLAA